MAGQPITDDIGSREYKKFVKRANGDYAVAVVLVDSAAGTTAYDSAEFAVANLAADYNVASNQAAAFNRVPTANTITIRTDHNISVKLNSTSDPAITIATVDSPFVLTNIPVSNLFITNNSGSAANVKLILI